jgi:hypothetical protein
MWKKYLGAKVVRMKLAVVAERLEVSPLHVVPARSNVDRPPAPAQVVHHVPIYDMVMCVRYVPLCSIWDMFKSTYI